MTTMDQHARVAAIPLSDSPGLRRLVDIGARVGVSKRGDVWTVELHDGVGWINASGPNLDEVLTRLADRLDEIL